MNGVYRDISRVYRGNTGFTAATTAYASVCNSN